MGAGGITASLCESRSLLVALKARLHAGIKAPVSSSVKREEATLTGSPVVLETSTPDETKESF
jgi:hypothetical protein